MKIRTRKADLGPEARMQLNREWRQCKRERRAIRHLLGALQGGKVTINRRTGRVVAVNGRPV